MGEEVSSPKSDRIFLQKKRISTGSVPTQSGANITVVWDEPFPDTNYTVVVTVMLDAAGDGLRSMRTRSKTTTQCVVHVWNSAVISQTGELHVIAIAD